jgi:hypothetical protein
VDTTTPGPIGCPKSPSNKQNKTINNKYEETIFLLFAKTDENKSQKK